MSVDYEKFGKRIVKRRETVRVEEPRTGMMMLQERWVNVEEYGADISDEEAALIPDAVWTPTKDGKFVTVYHGRRMFCEKPPEKKSGEIEKKADSGVAGKPKGKSALD